MKTKKTLMQEFVEEIQRERAQARHLVTMLAVSWITNMEFDLKAQGLGHEQRLEQICKRVVHVARQGQCGYKEPLNEDMLMALTAAIKTLSGDEASLQVAAKRVRDEVIADA